MVLFDERGRMRATREPEPAPVPIFTLIRGTSSCAWAVRSDVPEEIAAKLDRVAAQEPPGRDFDSQPLHAAEYQSLAGGTVESGPAFAFPSDLKATSEVVVVDNLGPLARHFRGWTAAEIPGRAPIVAIIDDGYPVSICFSGRISEIAAEAGVETAPTFRGRGFAAQVTAAWAAAIRASGRIPLYSTSLSNTASRAVARKLGLIQYATDWHLV